MTRGKVQGKVFGASLKRDETVPFQSCNGREFVGLYILKGNLEILSGEMVSIVHEGDFILAKLWEDAEQMVVYAVEASEIAVARITLPELY